MPSSNTQLGTLGNTIGKTVVLRSYTQPLSYPNGTNYNFVHRSYVFDVWSSNSPLPPNCRYVELQDLRWEGKLQPAFSEYYAASDPTILLPHNADGLIMTNLKQLATIPSSWLNFTAAPPGGDYFPFTLESVYNDDSYWTGTVRDRLTGLTLTGTNAALTGM